MSEIGKDTSSEQIQPHVQRMHEELGELKERMEKLEAFILNRLASIGKQDGDLLIKQLQYMHGYRTVLTERIGRS